MEANALSYGDDLGRTCGTGPGGSALGPIDARWRFLLVSVLGGGLFLMACNTVAPSPRPTPLVPTVMGVVAVRPQSNRVQLTSGKTVTLAPNAAALGTAGIDEGDLLLLPAEGGSAWFAALSPGSGGCFILDKPATDDGDYVLFDNGLRLPKYDPFDEGPSRSGRYEGFPDGFCVNSAGQAVRYE